MKKTVVAVLVVAVWVGACLYLAGSGGRETASVFEEVERDSGRRVASACLYDAAGDLIVCISRDPITTARR